ncbi:Sulfate transport system permease protein CysW [Sodalis glossinidius str. 'morsitans']|uniref:Thiamine transport system permease protein ThiP n=2 Tax=Sodalis glossinidius TaxID=63612 RepID=A0A193QG26_SODGM|nr:Sulfate transport system permease protein CysW [Sodalis glossinidius str. 'morsitans']
MSPAGRHGGASPRSPTPTQPPRHRGGRSGSDLFLARSAAVAGRVKAMPGWLWPGATAAAVIAVIALAAFSALWRHVPSHPWRPLLADRYLWHVVSFTFTQALLSALCATLPAVALARALYRRRFPGRALLLRFCGMTLVLPVLVGVFGIMSVFGQQGWLAQLCRVLQVEYRFSPYGLGGILLAHVFFNLPLATRLLLQALESIPVEQRQLAAQLGMTAGPFFRLVEWPYLRRQLLPAAALIFMLCFASFATVLALGGGPRATTIELAIYQALSYDFDVGRAALLALVQMVCCLGLVMLSQRLASALPVGHSHHARWRDRQTATGGRIGDALIILAALLLLLPPLLAVVIDGINGDLPTVLRQTALWRAVFTSLGVALCAGLLCLLLTGMLLWSSRELRLRQRWLGAQLLDLSGMVILAMPGIVLATGFFLLATDNGGLPASPAPVIILANALMAIPYALKVLESPMQDVAECYRQLCLTLNIGGLNRLRLVEWRALRQPAGRALAFACILSLGDFGVIALFGSEDFRTLPLYLYQQIGAYRSQDGAVTALVLLLLCLLLFTLFEKGSGTNDNA